MPKLFVEAYEIKKGQIYTWYYVLGADNAAIVINEQVPVMLKTIETDLDLLKEYLEFFLATVNVELKKSKKKENSE